MTFRAGDSVHHNPSGVNLLLACDEQDGKVFSTASGSWAAQDCSLLVAADDLQRMAMLMSTAAIMGKDSIAAHQLAALQAPPSPAPIPSPVIPTIRHGLTLEIFFPREVIEFTADEQAVIVAEFEVATHAALERMRPGAWAKLKAWLRDHA